MVFIPNFVTALAVLSVVGSTVAHPGEDHHAAKIKRDLKKLDVLAGHAKRSLGKCSDTLKARALNERALNRRAAIAQDLREKRGITHSELAYPWWNDYHLSCFLDFRLMVFRAFLPPSYSSGPGKLRIDRS